MTTRMLIGQKAISMSKTLIATPRNRAHLLLKLQRLHLQCLAANRFWRKKTTAS